MSGAGSVTPLDEQLRKVALKKCHEEVRQKVKRSAAVVALKLRVEVHAIATYPRTRAS